MKSHLKKANLHDSIVNIQINVMHERNNISHNSETIHNRTIPVYNTNPEDRSSKIVFRLKFLQMNLASFPDKNIRSYYTK